MKPCFTFWNPKSRQTPWHNVTLRHIAYHWTFTTELDTKMIINNFHSIITDKQALTWPDASPSANLPKSLILKIYKSSMKIIVINSVLKKRSTNTIEINVLYTILTQWIPDISTEWPLQILKLHVKNPADIFHKNMLLQNWFLQTNYMNNSFAI